MINTRFGVFLCYREQGKWQKDQIPVKNRIIGKQFNWEETRRINILFSKDFDFIILKCLLWKIPSTCKNMKQLSRFCLILCFFDMLSSILNNCRPYIILPIHPRMFLSPPMWTVSYIVRKKSSKFNNTFLLSSNIYPYFKLFIKIKM